MATHNCHNSLYGQQVATALGQHHQLGYRLNLIRDTPTPHVAEVEVEVAATNGESAQQDRN